MSRMLPSLYSRYSWHDKRFSIRDSHLSGTPTSSQVGYPAAQKMPMLSNQCPTHNGSCSPLPADGASECSQTYPRHFSDSKTSPAWLHRKVLTILLISHFKWVREKRSPMAGHADLLAQYCARGDVFQKGQTVSWELETANIHCRCMYKALLLKDTTKVSPFSLKWGSADLLLKE